MLWGDIRPNDVVVFENNVYYVIGAVDSDKFLDYVIIIALCSIKGRSEFYRGLFVKENVIENVYTIVISC